MVRIVFIGNGFHNRLNILHTLENCIINNINGINEESIMQQLPTDVIDLFVIDRTKPLFKKIINLINSNISINHIPIISLITKRDLENKIINDGDLFVSEFVTDIEFKYYVKTILKMKLMDDELKKDKIVLELKVKERTSELENKTNKLIESNYRLKQAELTSKSGNWEFHVSTNQIKSSEGCMKLYGIFIDIDDSVDFKIIKDCALPKYRPMLDKTMENLILHNKTYDVVYKIKPIDRDKIIDIHSIANYNKEMNIVYGVMRDVTKNKKQEKELLNNKEQFSYMFDNMKSAVVIYDTNDNGKSFFFSGINKTAEKLENVKKSEILNKKLKDLFPLAMTNGFVDYIKNVWKTNKSIQVPDFYYTSKDGKREGWRSNFIYKNLVTNEVVVMYDDITNRKKSEKDLDNTLSLLKSTLESTADGIVVMNNESGDMIQYNQKFLDMWEINKVKVKSKLNDNDVLGFLKKQLLYPEEFITSAKKIYSKKESTSFDIVEFIDGRFFERYSIPQEINNEFVGRVWSFRDITERIKHEKELEKARDLAEQSDKIKSVFISNMSHEIRTPMNSIIGFASLLEKEKDPEKIKKYIDILTRSGNLLLSLIDDIMDLSKVESGNMKIKKTSFDLQKLLKDIKSQFNLELINRNKNNINLKNIEKNYIIYSDYKRINQILNNLILNSIKFTTEGHIKYGFEIKDNFIEFYVEDTGIGIKQDDLELVFKRFYQIDREKFKIQEGTGLGLTICKAIIKLLGGELWIESEFGIGTTVYFTIPIENPFITKEKDDIDIIKINNEHCEGKRVLIVEDNNINYELLEILLLSYNMIIDRAKNHIEFFDKIENDIDYDLILMDIQLPGKDGWELLEWLKINKKDVPIIVQTAFISKETEIKSMELGAKYFITKPINAADLLNKVKMVCI